jgi:hypothetical protein
MAKQPERIILHDEAEEISNEKGGFQPLTDLSLTLS